MLETSVGTEDLKTHTISIEINEREGKIIP